MLQDVAQGAGLQPHVVGVEHGAQQGDGQGTFQRLGNIGSNQGHGIALADTALAQCRRQALAARCHLAPVAADTAVDLGGQFRVYPLDAF